MHDHVDVEPSGTSVADIDDGDQKAASVPETEFLEMSVAVGGGDRLAAVRSWQIEVRDITSEHRREVNGSRWWAYVAAYVVLVPVTAGYLFGINPTSTIGVLLAVLLLLVTVLAAVRALVAVYKDAKRHYENESPWIPNVTAYVGVPVVTFVVGYYVANLNAWEAPAAVGQYGFFGVCWLATVVSLLDRRRSVRTA